MGLQLKKSSLWWISNMRIWGPAPSTGCEITTTAGGGGVRQRCQPPGGVSPNFRGSPFNASHLAAGDTWPPVVTPLTSGKFERNLLLTCSSMWPADQLERPFKSHWGRFGVVVKLKSSGPYSAENNLIPQATAG